jgi:hypothetical protein
MKEQRERVFAVLRARRKGWLLGLPWYGVIGNPDIMLEHPLWGVVRGERVRFLHHWTVYAGSRRFEFNHPGETITDEIPDPLNMRVTREVEFRGKTYRYHSGVRFTYPKKHPNKKKVVQVWIPDDRHKGDPGAPSMAISADIHEILQLMYDLGEGVKNDPDL